MKKEQISRKKKKTGSVVPMEWKKKTGKMASCADSMAQRLRNKVEQGGESNIRPTLLNICKVNGLGAQARRWAHLNNGMFRMNLGNMLRARSRSGQKVEGL